MYALIAIAASAGVTIAAHYTSPPRRLLIYAFKPLTTILILVLALLPGTFLSASYPRLIALGLLFSLAGDIALMLPGDRFLQGLTAFLGAHLCYLLAFRQGASAEGFARGLLILLVVGGVVLSYIWPALPQKFKLPASVYSIVLMLMAATAIGRATGQPDLAASLAAIGALLFTASDGILTIERFRTRRPWLRAAVLGLYFAGQALIALSTGAPA